MVIAAYDAIESLIVEQISRSGNSAQSIYDKRLGDSSYPNHQYVPHCIYFFYIRINENGALKVDHYFFVKGPLEDPEQWEEIPYGDVEDILRDLARRARPSGVKDPVPLPDHNFENIAINRRSYIAFFLDEANWAFHKQVSGKFAMSYNEQKAGVQNHSFFDAKDFEFDMPDSRTGVFLVNHMKADADGNFLAVGESAKFNFDMYFDVNFADPTDQRLTIIFDPGGENQGPPEKP